MSDNKRIAKNALFLYFRMFLTMGVGLYTSRLVLEALGVVDYGIYGLVGGIVTLFSFLNSAMASASQRYLSFDIGKNDEEQLKKTFNATVNIHFLIAFIVLVLAETIGLWFVNYKLNIPLDRLSAANWVFQFSIFSFLLAIIQVPYNALLFAREHMNVYAYFSILETLLKLLIVFLLLQWDADKLIIYAILTFIISFIIQTSYKLYCKKYFKESVYQFYYDKKYYKELISYSGWNLFGSIAVVARGQGVNILLNLFFGPILNASYGIAIIVQSVLISFVNNFQISVNPQIIKKYSNQEITSCINLILMSSKYSFFGLFLLIVPVYFNIDYILKIWLIEVPSYTTDFIRLTLIFVLIEVLSNPLITGVQATGNIKFYQIIVGSLIFLTLPVTWFLFKIYESPFHLYFTLIFISIVGLIFRVVLVNRILGIKILDFLKNVIVRISLVVISSISLIVLFREKKASTFTDFFNQSSIIVIITILFIFVFGLTKNEHKYFFQLIKTKLFNKL